MGHSDAVFRTSGGARLRALHLAEYLDTQRWRLTKTRMQSWQCKGWISKIDFVSNPKRARQVWVREFQGNNTGGSCFVYVGRPTGSEHAREMSHQMQGDAVVDWLLQDGDPIC